MDDWITFDKLQPVALVFIQTQEKITSDDLPEKFKNPTPVLDIALEEENTP